ncbi:mitochondrial carrier domain-containing protein [Xylariaceae sp. FL1019]|nr:mitochondrial carrier domain-containing protein [Xylariaceae sp. FL1019]
MPSALADHGPVSAIPPAQGRNSDSLVGKMDGALRKAGHAVTTGADRNIGTSASVDASAAPENRKKPSKHSMDYIVRSFIAGGFAGCAAKTAVAPLDRVKILFQTNNPQFAKYTGSWAGLGRALGDIYTQHGVRGLFRGHSATLLKIYPYAAIKFVAYEQYRALIIHGRHHETWFRRFTVGALAGVTSVLFTYPLEVIRVRLAFETKVRSSSLTDICKQIYYEHPVSKSTTAAAAAAPAGGSGTAGSVVSAASSTVQAAAPQSGIINFYRGFSTTLLGMLPYAGVSFLTHDTIGDIFRSSALREHATLPQPSNAPKDKPAPLRAWAELLSGGISGAIAQTVSYPLEVVRRRMQVGGAVGDGHRLRVGETVGMIFKQRGLPGFFVGLTIGYVKVFPMSAVSFYTYERMKTILSI